MSNSGSWTPQGLVSLKLVGNAGSLDVIPNLSPSVVWLILGKFFLPLIISFSFPLIFYLICSWYKFFEIGAATFYLQKTRKPKLAVTQLSHNTELACAWHFKILYKQVVKSLLQSSKLTQHTQVTSLNFWESVANHRLQPWNPGC